MTALFSLLMSALILQAYTQSVGPPTDLAADQNGPTSVRVSWMAPASGTSDITSYRITYSTGGGSEQSVDVRAGVTSRTLSDLQSGATYSISIVALVGASSSTAEGSVTVTVQEILAPTVMTEVLGSTSIRVTFSQPSGSLPAEKFEIQYTRVMGTGQRVCLGIPGSGSATKVQSPYTITNLEEFSAYSITVTAFVFNEIRTTTELAMTSPTAPSGPPQSVVVSSVTSKSITLQWGRVNCIDRNSVVTCYSVKYHQDGTTTTFGASVSGTGLMDRVFTANGLLPRTNYTFEVAAFSSEGTGPFSTSITAETAVPEGIVLQLNGQRYGNNSLVILTAIGEGDSTALLCLTDRVQCCGYSQSGDGETTGHWYYPNNGSTLSSGITGASIYISRGASRVQLNRRNNAQTPTGIYRCEVPDANGTNYSIYVGVVRNANTEGTPTIRFIQFELTSAINATTPSFNLHCTTMGGPVDFSDITWTRAGSSLPANHGLFQALVDRSTATYSNTLAVTGRETGQYMCQVERPGGYSVTRFINVEDANPPSGLTAVQSRPTSVNVSWTAPAPGGATRISYRIFYETGGSEQSVGVGAGATSHTLTGLQSGATYVISIIALSDRLPSTVVGPVTSDDYVVPAVATLVLGPTSIRVTFIQPSGHSATSYNIQYTRTLGAGQGLCSHRASPEDSMLFTGVASPYDITSLQEFSTYDITVTAVFSGAMVQTTVQNTTLVAVPSAAPRNLKSATVVSSSISVRWNAVERIDRNGVIDTYIVRFGPEGGVQSESIVQSGGIGVAGTYTASGLTPSTRYSFEVAPVNSAGTGPFTAPILVDPPRDVSNESPPAPPVVSVGAVTATQITLSWSLQSGVRQYEVHYVRAVGSQQLGGCLNSTDTASSILTVDNSLTLEALQEFHTYTITVFAVSNVGRVPSEDIVVMTQVAAPAAPSGLEVVNFTDTAITVAWLPLQCFDINSQFEITGYTLRYGLISEPEISMAFQISLPIVTISILVSGEEYFIEVAAVNSIGEVGAFSSRITQTTSGGQNATSGTTAIPVLAAVLVVLIIAASVTAVIITVRVLKHRQTPSHPQEHHTEAVMLSPLADSAKPGPTISTVSCEAYQSVGQQGQAEGDHTYESIVPRRQQPRPQEHTAACCEST